MARTKLTKLPKCDKQLHCVKYVDILKILTWVKPPPVIPFFFLGSRKNNNTTLCKGALQ